MQFTGAEPVNMIPLISKLLDEMEDLIAIKGLKVKKSVRQVFELKINPELAGILLSNLVSNAIKHNIKEGYIEIIQNDNALVFRNSGLPLSYPERELFNRFSKDRPASRSLGLGLAIVKKICEQYRIPYEYTCVNSVHSFTIQSAE
jgi:signal transduction histidine kinase